MAETQKNKPVTESQVMRRNIVIAFVLMFLLLLLYVLVPGYNYAIKDVAISNKQKIDQIETRRLNFNLPELRMEDKFLFRIEDYWYIQFMCEHTPDTAVILLPPASVIDTTPGMGQINDPEWMEYFLYPRLCISEDQKNEKKELYNMVTHVAIVNGWGYNKLKYEPKEHPSETILPVNRPLGNEVSKGTSAPIKPGFYTPDSVNHKPAVLNQ